MRIEKLTQTFNIKTRYVHFPLHPDTPQEGRSLEQLFGSGPEAVQAKNANMKKLMSQEGLPYGERTHTYNSRLAQELGCWADTKPGGEAIHDAIFKAYFVEQKNVGDPSVLLDIVKEIGLPVDEAQTVIEQRTFKDQVDVDWQKSHQYGVTGVPTFVAGRTGVVGAQPYDVIERMLTEAGAKRR